MMAGAPTPTAKNLFALKALVIFLGVVFITLVIVFCVLLASDTKDNAKEMKSERQQPAAAAPPPPAVLQLVPGERVVNVYAQGEAFIILQIEGSKETRIVTLQLTNGDVVTRAVVRMHDDDTP